MSGYRWDPVFRVSPVNGADTFYWLSDRLSDVGSHTRIGLRYVESMNVREDVNRSLRPVMYGLRPEVDITCTIWTMADQAFLSEIESALLDPLYYNVFLSLDGGVVYRQVVMAAVANAEPIAGKTIVGAQFTIRMRCVDLIPRRPAMMTDPAVGAEISPNGGFELWTLPTVAAGWTASGVSTAAQEATIFRGGINSAKITRSDGSSFGGFSASCLGIPRAGVWHRVSLYHRGSISMALISGGPLRLQFWNPTLNVWLDSDGKTWSTNSAMALITAGTSTSFALAEAYFRLPTQYFDSLSVRMSGYWTSGESMYYDDLTIVGPVLRPGVSTW